MDGQLHQSIIISVSMATQDAELRDQKNPNATHRYPYHIYFDLLFEDWPGTFLEPTDGLNLLLILYSNDSRLCFHWMALGTLGQPLTCFIS
jgi:hypothetical protein